jgi:hypothetical protein
MQLDIVWNIMYSMCGAVIVIRADKSAAIECADEVPEPLSAA